MSVVSGGKIIFCEGKGSSLDYSLLDKVVDGIPGDRCTIVPAGSKFTFSIFAEGYLSNNQAVNQKYIVFRDRDFDIQPTANCQLLPLGNRLGNSSIVLTYRACIENYLLDPNLIHTYWLENYRQKQENPKLSKWGHQDSPGIDLISAWIESSAKNLQAYQAVRWALSDLVNMSAAREQLKTTWTGNSGTLPASLDLQDCKSEALGLINEFRQAVETVTTEKFEDSLAMYQNQFEQENFWTQKQYLIWFHGKDIQRQMEMQKQLQQQKHHYISLTKYFRWGINNLDFTQHPDIMELRSRIEQL
ncbi:DUF4435 domain-containing protein [Planktothrix paucivesiculata]|uniref:DUF4435 domain-containing protein n=1 Tax=Planktothrix paucivesiculata PCC 9631 TaxID=671071 RepID=A0A7Z9C1E1_9CYAN|nr:DUF4435 domain-containing protein [Planktothrix paucivesiculata]VXD25255.1 conserved hypothetical protein [Planktothrix paucivesiculata PCC 9631]